MTRFRLLRGFLTLGAVASVLAGCAGASDRVMAARCGGSLNAGYRDLDLAKGQGFGRTQAWSKAATLLAAAKVQQQFDRYADCVEKADRARRYIRQSRTTG